MVCHTNRVTKDIPMKPKVLRYSLSASFALIFLILSEITGKSRGERSRDRISSTTPMNLSVPTVYGAMPTQMKNNANAPCKNSGSSALVISSSPALLSAAAAGDGDGLRSRARKKRFCANETGRICDMSA